MQKRIIGFYPNGSKLTFVDIFAYSSRGIPGIEVVGLGPLGRSIKEKFYFFSRENRLKIPPRRYVLCLDIQGMPKRSEDLNFLELPLLILFWSLAEVLSLKNIDKCVASGKLLVGGALHLPFLDERALEFLERFNEQDDRKFLGIESEETGGKVKLIDVNRFLGHFFSIEQVK